MPATATDRLYALTTSVAVKPPCVVATTAAVTLAGLQTIGGIAVATGDRVLVKDQANPIDNGIYVANTSAWSRAPDFNGPRDAVDGTIVTVGDDPAAYFYKLSAVDPVVIGSSALTFVPATIAMPAYSQALPYDNGSVAQGLQLRGISVDDYPYLASSQSTPALCLTMLEAARDRALALGVSLIFGQHTYEIEAALKFKTGSHWIFAGIDKTIFKLGDDAALGANVMQPDTYDGTVTDVVLEGGFTLDGNYSRFGEAKPASAGNRPGDSCFVTGGAKNVRIIGGAKAVDGLLHGFDITGGGEVEGSQRYYIAPANLTERAPSYVTPAYYPPNGTDGFYADYLEGVNNGDDGVTVHTARNVYIDRVYVPVCGHRHSSANASNCFEADDASRDVYVGEVVGIGGIACVEIKTHGDAPAPHNINIGRIYASGCRRGFSISDGGWSSGDPLPDAYGIRIGRIVATNPADPNPGSTEAVMAAALQNYADVEIDSIVARALGTEAAGFMHCAVRAYSGYKNIRIGSIDAENWAYDNITDTAIAALGITSTGSGIRVGDVRAKNCGYRGIAVTGANPIFIGTATLEGASLAGSIGIRLSTHPAVSGSTIGSVTGSGYVTLTSYDSETRSYPAAVLNGLQVAGGMVNIGASVTKTIASGAVTVGDASYVRLAGQGGVADDLTTINGGVEGDLLYLRAASSTVDITIKHGAGNISLNGSTDFVLTTAADTLVLICSSGGGWVEVGRGDNGA